MLSSSRSSTATTGLPCGLGLLGLDVDLALVELLAERLRRQDHVVDRLQRAVAREIDLGLAGVRGDERTIAAGDFFLRPLLRLRWRSASCSIARRCSGVSAWSVFLTGTPCLLSSTAGLVDGFRRHLVRVVDDALFVDPLVRRGARLARPGQEHRHATSRAAARANPSAACRHRPFLRSHRLPPCTSRIVNMAHHLPCFTHQARRGLPACSADRPRR